MLSGYKTSIHSFLERLAPAKPYYIWGCVKSSIWIDLYGDLKSVSSLEVNSMCNIRWLLKKSRAHWNHRDGRDVFPPSCLIHLPAYHPLNCALTHLSSHLTSQLHPPHSLSIHFSAPATQSTIACLPFFPHSFILSLLSTQSIPLVHLSPNQSTSVAPFHIKPHSPAIYILHTGTRPFIQTVTHLRSHPIYSPAICIPYTGAWLFIHLSSQPETTHSPFTSIQLLFIHYSLGTWVRGKVLGPYD